MAASLAAAGYAAMAGARGFVAIFLAYAAISIVAAPVLPLGDAYGLRGLNARGLAYGPVRLWGSVAFIFANMAGGMLLTRFGAAPIAFALAGAMALTAAATLLLPRASETAAAAKVPAASTGSLWKSAPVRYRRARRKPHPGKPCRALRLRHAAMERRRSRRHHNRPVVGDRRHSRDTAVCGLGPIDHAHRRDRDHFPWGGSAASCAGPRWRSIRPRRCCRRCNAFTRCRSARRMWARCMCWRASPAAARPPRATSPPCRASPLPPQWRCPANLWRNSPASPISPWRRSRRPVSHRPWRAA